MSRFDDSIWQLSCDDDESYPEYDMYPGEWNGTYHENFPNEWAENHEECTGPEECPNCSFYGCVQGVFVGYCGNCAMHVYKGSRGRGFIGDGIENTSVEAAQYTSVFDTYLKDIVFYQEELDDPMEQGDPEELDDPMEQGDPEELDDPMEQGDPNDYTETSVLNCHFEGGYADF
jgi:hypothetical protein